MSLQARAQASAAGMKPVIGKRMKQLGNSSKHNADILAAVVTNSSRDAAPDSRRSNPAMSAENEKYDIAEQIREKTKMHVSIAADSLKKTLIPALTQFTAKGSPMVQPLATALAMVKDLMSLTIKLGMVRSHGWKMLRLSDVYAIFAKAFTVNTESAVRFQAPAILNSAQVVDTAASVVQTTADVEVHMVKDEIHRIAEVFAIDANYLTAVLRAAAVIHATGKIDIASASQLTMTGAAGVKVVGATIDLNPIGGVPLPTVPVTPAFAPSTKPPPVKTVPQYKGVAAQGTTFI